MSGHVVLTGPITGTVVVNGEPVDVTPSQITVDSAEFAHAVAAAITDAHTASGFLPEG